MSAAIANRIPTLPASQELPPKGRVGILSLILTESVFFSIFVVAYLFYVGKSMSGPLPKDVLSLPIGATACLLLSSVTIVVAVRALRAGLIELFGVWWFATLLLALLFLFATSLEWHRLIYRRHLTIATNLFGTTYYSLVGLHAAHVIIGALLIGVVLVFTCFGKMESRHVEKVDMLSWYWHFVDAVWVVVFLTVYVIGR